MARATESPKADTEKFVPAFFFGGLDSAEDL